MVALCMHQRQAVAAVGLAVIVHLAVVGLLLAVRMDAGESISPEAGTMVTLVDMVSEPHNGADARLQGDAGTGLPPTAAQPAAREKDAARQDSVAVLAADQHRKVRHRPRPSTQRQPAAMVPADDGSGAMPGTGSQPADVVAAAAASDSEAVTVTSVQPRYRGNPQPEYPRLARRRGWQGKVVLDVTVLANGSVGDIRLSQSSSHDLLDRVAMKTVRRWAFMPERRDGRPVTARVRVPVRFVLQD